MAATFHQTVNVAGKYSDSVMSSTAGKVRYDKDSSPTTVTGKAVDEEMGRVTRTTDSVPKIMTFQPSWEEFKDLDKYVKYMEEQGAHHAGIAKIKPPPEYQPTDHEKLKNYVIHSPITYQKLPGKNGAYVFEKAKTPGTNDRKHGKDKKTSALRKSTPLNVFIDEANTEETKPPQHSKDGLVISFWGDIVKQPNPAYAFDLNGTLMRTDLNVWNLNKLGSILDVLKEHQDDEGGILSSYLYFGTWRSFFVWHTEDYELYSANYLHVGAPKCWYAIPPQYARKFEALVQKVFDINVKCPNVMRHKLYMITPELLDKHEIPYDTVVQEEGELIITFPYGFHMGFNMGFNIAEAVNFATDRWIEYGMFSKLCECKPLKPCRLCIGALIKKFRPHLYEKWLKGEIVGHHPLFPDEIVKVRLPFPFECDILTEDEYELLHPIAKDLHMKYLEELKKKEEKQNKLKATSSSSRSKATYETRRRVSKMPMTKNRSASHNLAPTTAALRDPPFKKRKFDDVVSASKSGESNLRYEQDDQFVNENNEPDDTIQVLDLSRPGPVHSTDSRSMPEAHPTNESNNLLEPMPPADLVPSLSPSNATNNELQSVPATVDSESSLNQSPEKVSLNDSGQNKDDHISAPNENHDDYEDAQVTNFTSNSGEQESQQQCGSNDDQNEKQICENGDKSPETAVAKPSSDNPTTFSGDEDVEECGDGAFDESDNDNEIIFRLKQRIKMMEDERQFLLEELDEKNTFINIQKERNAQLEKHYKFEVECLQKEIESKDRSIHRYQSRMMDKGNKLDADNGSCFEFYSGASTSRSRRRNSSSASVVSESSSQTSSKSNKNFKCDHCGKSYGSKTALAFHEKRKHSDEKLICKICKLPYSTPYRLMRHMDTHKKELATSTKQPSPC